MKNVPDTNISRELDSGMRVSTRWVFTKKTKLFSFSSSFCYFFFFFFKFEFNFLFVLIGFFVIFLLSKFNIDFVIFPLLTPFPILISAFVIKHFSDTVQYQSTGFLEKNRDTISKELVNVMRESNLPICRTLMSLDEHSATQGKETSLDGRVKINAAKHLVKIHLCYVFFASDQRFFRWLTKTNVFLSVRQFLCFNTTHNIFLRKTTFFRDFSFYF